MEIRTTYKGIKDGVYGIYCGFKPDGLEVEEEIQVYYPDKDKVFIKDGKEYVAVILKDGEKIEDYTEQEKQIEENETIEKL